MTTNEKVQRILSTRLGSRPGRPLYGSRMYLLRDKRADGGAAVWFAKYAHEDITRSDPTIEVKEAKLTAISNYVVTGEITLSDGSISSVEVTL